MREARGNMLEMECDALVITTNGFTKANGDAVMGRGIAKQVNAALPWVSTRLGALLRTEGNIPHLLGQHQQIDLVSFPVKPTSVVYDGSNIVAHAQAQFKPGDRVPGFYAKAVPEMIVASAKDLVFLADKYGWQTILVPRFGCGAGELDWEDIKPLVAPILDDRYIACTYSEIHMTQQQLNLFYEILNTKNSWGKNEIRQVLLEIIAGIRTTV